MAALKSIQGKLTRVIPPKQGPQGLRGPVGPAGERGAAGIPGEKGDKGDIPAHKWVGNSLAFQNPDGTWGKEVDLTGPQGPAGSSTGSGGVVGGGPTVPDIVQQVAAELGVDVTEATRTDFDGAEIIYKGWAPAGSSESAPVWRIRKRTISSVDGDIADYWPDGDTGYNYIWTDRATLNFT